MRKLSVALYFFGLGIAQAQWTHGPAVEIAVYFTECRSFQTSTWSNNNSILKCSKVIFSEDSKSLWMQQHGVRKGEHLEVKDVFVAPDAWNPGQKKVVDLSSVGGFCQSFNENCRNFFKGAIENYKILKNYVPFTSSLAKSPDGEEHMILNQGYYSLHSILGKSDVEIYALNIPGKFYVLPWLLQEDHLQEGVYSIQDNRKYKVIAHQDQNNSQVFAFDKTKFTFHPVVGAVKVVKDFSMALRSGIALTGLLKQVNGYASRPILTESVEGMFDEGLSLSEKNSKSIKKIKLYEPLTDILMDPSQRHTLAFQQELEKLKQECDKQRGLSENHVDKTLSDELCAWVYDLAYSRKLPNLSKGNKSLSYETVHPLFEQLRYERQAYADVWKILTYDQQGNEIQYEFKKKRFWISTRSKQNIRHNFLIIGNLNEKNELSMVLELQFFNSETEETYRQKGFPSGLEAMHEIIHYFEVEQNIKINTVQTEWTVEDAMGGMSVNGLQYALHLKEQQDMQSKLKAAASTWEGLILQSLGFTDISLMDERSSYGSLNSVSFKFEKPERAEEN